MGRAKSPWKIHKLYDNAIDKYIYIYTIKAPAR